MTAKAQRQLALLAGLVVVFVLALVWGQPGRGPTAAPGGAPSNAAGPGALPPGSEVAVADVNLARLRRERPPLPEPRRNPFEFRAVPAPRASAREAAMPRFEDVPPPMPVGPPPVPPIPLRFIGVFESASRGRVGMFSDTRTGQGIVFHAREGEIIEGRFRVVRLGPDSADLTHLDGRGRQTLRQSGQ